MMMYPNGKIQFPAPKKNPLTKSQDYFFYDLIDYDIRTEKWGVDARVDNSLMDRGLVQLTSKGAALQMAAFEELIYGKVVDVGLVNGIKMMKYQDGTKFFPASARQNLLNGQKYSTAFCHMINFKWESSVLNNRHLTHDLIQFTEEGSILQCEALTEFILNYGQAIVC